MNDVINLPPGIYYDVSWADYTKIPYMNQSTLKHGMRSMKRLKRAIDGELKFDGTSIAIGNAVHTVIAGEFDQRVVVMPQFELMPENLTAGTKTVKTKPKGYLKANGDLSAAGIKWDELLDKHGKPADFDGEIVIVSGQKQTESRSTSFYQTSVARFREENRGKIILNQSEMDTANRCLESMRACPEAVDLIKTSKSEAVVIAEIEGVMCKTRMDGLRLEDGKAWDLKTTNDIEPKALYRTVKKLGYLFQIGFQKLCLRNAGTDATWLDSYDLIVVETQDDFDCGVVGVEPVSLIDDWCERVTATLQDYRASKSRGVWPGLYPNRDVLQVPSYDMSDAQFEG